MAKGGRILLETGCYGFGRQMRKGERVVTRELGVVDFLGFSQCSGSIWDVAC